LILEKKPKQENKTTFKFKGIKREFGASRSQSKHSLHLIESLALLLKQMPRVKPNHPILNIIIQQ
jgi:hypothetical protein